MTMFSKQVLWSPVRNKLNVTPKTIQRCMRKIKVSHLFFIGMIHKYIKMIHLETINLKKSFY